MAEATVHDFSKMETDEINRRLAKLREVIASLQAERNALEQEFHSRDSEAQLATRAAEFMASLSPKQRESLLKKQEEAAMQAMKAQSQDKQ